MPRRDEQSHLIFFRLFMPAKGPDEIGQSSSFRFSFAKAFKLVRGRIPPYDGTICAHDIGIDGGLVWRLWGGLVVCHVNPEMMFHGKAPVDRARSMFVSRSTCKSVDWHELPRRFGCPHHSVTIAA